MKTKLMVLALSLLTLPAMAAQEPRPLGTDSRVRHVMFNPNEIYEVKATFGYQTTIEFSDTETVQVASIGDSIAWQVHPLGNRLFLKPVEVNPKTNLTVVTNKRTYYFNLSTVSEKLISDMTYLVRFEYAENNPLPSNSPFKEKSPQNFNFDYKLKKDRKSGLIRAFDNGEFTYLQFRNTNDLPAIFFIDPVTKKEAVVNYRVEGPYVVVERVAQKYLFRRGKVVGLLMNKNSHPSKSS